ncbi:cytochrome c [Spirosoma aureum]|uniref:Cytochrome c n=1 Tax=Spirosoma aureum TaxID=2692134 RepID=A0A6G9AP59_9BACT|nr:cytochrome c [Spirosoma aureum]QIP14178.1 cytochrome c [Spirosoma aureum]
MSLKTVYILAILLTVTAIMATTFTRSNDQVSTTLMRTKAVAAPIKKDSVTSVKAFASVYKVLMSPRCMNCHPAGDIPLQGDDNHLHTMAPRRGTDGKGIYAMKCANCHQPTNTPGLHTPPGNPDWHLPPATMRMVFQGRTPQQLAKQLVDPKLNGGKNMEKLLEHADDGLVLAGWNPGEGRTLPPLSHADFKKAWTTWLKTGAYAPKP